MRCVVVDYGLQAGSVEMAKRTVGALTSRGIAAEVRHVEVGRDGGIEATVRQACLATLSCDGHPVLLGHILDGQAETVLLGLLHDSGIWSLAGMSVRRGPFLRSLLGTRRTKTEAVYREWEVERWDDPMNTDPWSTRVRACSVLALLASELGRDVAVGLIRTVELARGGADLLDKLTEFALVRVARDDALNVVAFAGQPDVLRDRVLLGWLWNYGSEATRIHIATVDDLVLA